MNGTRLDRAIDALSPSLHTTSCSPATHLEPAAMAESKRDPAPLLADANLTYDSLFPVPSQPEIGQFVAGRSGMRHATYHWKTTAARCEGVVVLVHGFGTCV